MDYFNNIEITFNYKGHTITGKLNGDLIHWQFNSQDEFFKGFFPNGVIYPRISFKTSDQDLDGILNSFYSEADKLIG